MGSLLAFNVGNTRLALGVFRDDVLEHVERIPHDQRQRWPERISAAWQRLGRDGEAALAGVSVNPPTSEALDSVVAGVAGRRVRWVGREIPVPIPVLTEHPQQTGLDRVLNVAAAHARARSACIVVDAGTAVTVNVCNARGEFLGGAIGAGASLMLRALHEKTAKLPLVALDAPAEPIGRNTQQAILHGVYFGVRGLVRELVERYRAVLGEPVHVVATGGDAVRLFDTWNVVTEVVPDLTLHGVALAHRRQQHRP
ncbi:MAG: type III pantothenate kinase [Myxococcota bacterium]